jgi:hypothetical protein
MLAPHEYTQELSQIKQCTLWYRYWCYYGPMHWWMYTVVPVLMLLWVHALVDAHCGTGTGATVAHALVNVRCGTGTGATMGPCIGRCTLWYWYWCYYGSMHWSMHTVVLVLVLLWAHALVDAHCGTGTGATMGPCIGRCTLWYWYWCYYGPMHWSMHTVVPVLVLLWPMHWSMYAVVPVLVLLWAHALVDAHCGIGTGATMGPCIGGCTLWYRYWCYYGPMHWSMYLIFLYIRS